MFTAGDTLYLHVVLDRLASNIKVFVDRPASERGGNVLFETVHVSDWAEKDISGVCPICLNLGDRHHHLGRPQQYCDTSSGSQARISLRPSNHLPTPCMTAFPHNSAVST